MYNSIKKNKMTSEMIHNMDLGMIIEIPNENSVILMQEEVHSDKWDLCKGCCFRTEDGCTSPSKQLPLLDACAFVPGIWKLKTK